MGTDPVSVVVGALAAGAANGVSESATATVRDAYADLRRLVEARLSRRRRRRSRSVVVLERFETDPHAWERALGHALEQAGG